jgi:transposase-like protein
MRSNRLWKFIRVRRIKPRTNVMLGFKRVRNAAILIAGIELMHCIRKGQFKLPVDFQETAVPAIWNTVLSA